jgi:hypothetical protein
MHIEHNLKTVYFKETIGSGYFLAICVFLQRSIYHRTAAASSSVAMVGVLPYHLLEGTLGQQQLASSDCTLRCSNGFAHGDVVRRRRRLSCLEIGKSSSQLFSLSLTPLMWP